MELLHDILTLRPDLRETTGSGAESGMSDIAITINPFVVILYFAWLGKPGFAIGGVLGQIAGYRGGRPILGAVAGALLGLVLWLTGWWAFFR